MAARRSSRIAAQKAPKNTYNGLPRGGIVKNNTNLPLRRLPAELRQSIITHSIHLIVNQYLEPKQSFDKPTKPNESGVKSSDVCKSIDESIAQ